MTRFIVLPTIRQGRQYYFVIDTANKDKPVGKPYRTPVGAERKADKKNRGTVRS